MSGSNCCKNVWEKKILNNSKELDREEYERRRRVESNRRLYWFLHEKGYTVFTIPLLTVLEINGLIEAEKQIIREKKSKQK